MVNSKRVFRPLDLSQIALEHQGTMSWEQPTELTYELDPDETVTEGIIKATAAAYNLEPTSLDPLYSALDPDALDALFNPGHSGNPKVEFQYNGCDVHVTSDRKIVIRTTGTEG